MGEAIDIKYICRGPRIDGTFLGCGQDVTDLINAIAPNGIDHIVTCPKCLTEISAMKSGGRKIRSKE